MAALAQFFYYNKLLYIGALNYLQPKIVQKMTTNNLWNTTGMLQEVFPANNPCSQFLCYLTSGCWKYSIILRIQLEFIMLIGTSPAQINFVKQSVLHNIRIDGRNNWNRRTPAIKTGILPHLPGSSYLYLQHENIEIYTGIKLKLEKVQKISQNPALVCLEISSMLKLSQEDQEELARLQNLLQEFLIGKLAHQEDLKKYLSIPEAKKHEIHMSIDVFLLSTPHIEQLELIQNGIKSALNSTVIHEVSVAYNEVTDEESAELTGNDVKITLENWDQVMVIGVVEDREFVTDLRKEEYEAMDTCFLVAISDGKVTQIQTLKGSTTPDVMNKAVRFAVSVQERHK